MTRTSAPSPVSLLLVGTGRMGLRHLSRLLVTGTFRVAGTVDPGGPPPQSQAQAPWYTNLATALRDLGPQTALVAVPDGLHVSAARMCLDAGCHVLLEKPIDRNPVRARQLARAFAEQGRVLLSAHAEPWNPVMAFLRDWKAAPRRIETWRFSPYPHHRLEGADPATDLLVHDIDLALKLLAPWEPVPARGSPICAESSVSRRIQWTGGSGLFRAGWSHRDVRRTWMVEDAAGDTWFLDLGTRRVRHRRNFGGWDEISVPSGDGDALDGLHRSFAHCVAGLADHRTDLMRQIQALEICAGSTGPGVVPFQSCLTASETWTTSPP